MTALPEDVVARFRELALETVERIEAGWGSLVEAPSDVELASAMRRDLHTLKGDARIVGFTDVNQLCHKLEDLFDRAHQRAYKVHEEFDVVMTMAFGFLSMLLRAGPGPSPKGIDLPGFIVSLDQLMAEDRQRSADETAVPSSGNSSFHSDAPDRVSPQGRFALAAIATDVFVASLVAPPPLAGRLHRTWGELRRQIAGLAETQLAARLERHALAARELARTLGKDVDVVFDVGDLRAPPEVAVALDIALLHSMRNAVDHGIEAPLERERLGKSASASVVVRAIESDESIELTIEDDGRGVDFENVRRRARELGLTPDTDESLVDLLFRPGFSTTRRVTDLSGRGVGLDAARAAVEKQRGTIHLAPRAAGGVRVSIRFARSRRRVVVRPFLALGSLRMAVDSAWETEGVRDVKVAPAAFDLREPLGLLGVPLPGAPASSNALLRLSRGGTTLVLCAAHDDRTLTAERLCPTAENLPFEVVSAEGREWLLVRPDVLLAPPPSSTGGRREP